MESLIKKYPINNKLLLMKIMAIGNKRIVLLFISNAVMKILLLKNSKGEGDLPMTPLHTRP